MPEGKLIHYNHERGFGFIKATPENIFVHATTFEKAGIRARRGIRLRYEPFTGLHGRARAIDIEQVVKAEAG